MGNGPNVRQRRVARRLREWRRDKGVTLQDVATALRWNIMKLSRFERAETAAGPADVIALAAVLGISEQERDHVVATCIEASGSNAGWWTAYTPETVPAAFTDYLETEADATTVRAVEEILVPGLLQTGPYAEELFAANLSSLHERALVKDRRNLRQQRQAHLDDATEPLELHAIIHENALTKPVGGVEVMAEQLDALSQRAAQPNITVQVIPESLGAYPWMGSSAYHILDFDDSESAVYIDIIARGLYLEEDADVEAYTHAFQRLVNLALDPESSAKRIAEIRGGLA